MYFSYNRFKRSSEATHGMARLRSFLCGAGTRLKSNTTHDNTLHGRDRYKLALILDKFMTLSEGDFKDYILKNYNKSELDIAFSFAYESACCCDVRVLLDIEQGKIDKCLNRLVPLVSAGQCQHVTNLQLFRSPFMSGLPIKRVDDDKWKLEGGYGSFNVVYKARVCSSIRLAHLACAHGKFELVKTLKEIGCDFGSPNEKDMSPFEMAIIYGHMDIFNFLISEVETKISDKSLIKAADHARVDMLSELLTREPFSKACVSAALSSAVYSCDTAITEMLLRAGAIPSKEAMNFVISTEDLSTVERFLTSGAEIDPGSLANAVITENVDMVQLLISRGWTEKLNRNLDTPLLIWAVFNNHVTIVKTLIGQNADINVNHRGYTALDWALALGWAECILCLESIGAKSNPEITLHSPPLLEIWNVKPTTVCAADVIDRLVCRGGDVNVCKNVGTFDTRYQTPLGLAVSKRDIQSIKCLLKYGADPFYCHEEDGNNSPLFTAIFRGDWAVVREMILCNVAAFPNSTQKKLFFDKICDRGYHNYVDLLLKCGWKIDRKDLMTLHEKCDNDELKAVFKEHMMNKLQTLSSLCENTVRHFCAFNIHEFLHNQLLPIPVKYELSLKGIIQEFGHFH